MFQKFKSLNRNNDKNSISMKEEKIQTLHPHPDKKNKRISLEKYELIKATMINLLNEGSLTHTELMEQLIDKLKDNFEGRADWYGETVKLDLEARKIIERTGKKPERYRLVTTSR